MPQMSPYNWLIMNLYFSSLMMMMISLIYFNYFNKNYFLLKFYSPQIKKFMMKW